MKKFLSMLLIAMLLTASFTAVSANEEADAYSAYAENTKAYMRTCYNKALSMYGRYNFYGYCAACVSYQLISAGVNYGYMAGNGNQTYANYANRYMTSGGYLIKKYPGNAYTIYDVLTSLDTAEYGTRYYPVVIGFKKGTARPAGQTYGHTLIIYSVCGGKVYYTESLSFVTEENIRISTIEDFCNFYKDSPETYSTEFVFDGAVVFYKSAPDRAEVRTNKSRYAVGENVEFRASSSAATTYYIGIDKDGQRLVTADAGRDGRYTASFSEPGEYTVYVSACNAFGYKDSTPISFSVVAAPGNQYMLADKESAAPGENVTLTYGSDSGDNYFLGITHPDGTYEVVNTGSETVYTCAYEVPGVYTVYASCCNFVGYADTNPVTFEIK